MSRTDWLLAAVLALGIGASMKLWSLSGGVEVLVKSRIEPTQSARANWREVNGVANSITTYREIDETDAEFVARHQDAVDAMTQRMSEEPRTTRVEHR